MLISVSLISLTIVSRMGCAGLCTHAFCLVPTRGGNTMASKACAQLCVTKSRYQICPSRVCGSGGRWFEPTQLYHCSSATLNTVGSRREPGAERRHFATSAFLQSTPATPKTGNFAHFGRPSPSPEGLPPLQARSGGNVFSECGPISNSAPTAVAFSLFNREETGKNRVLKGVFSAPKTP